MDSASSYELVTNRAEQAILQLIGESRGQLDEDNQTHWDMANGVMLLWRDLAGDDCALTVACREINLWQFLMEALLPNVPCWQSASCRQAQSLLDGYGDVRSRQLTPHCGQCESQRNAPPVAEPMLPKL